MRIHGYTSPISPTVRSSQAGGSIREFARQARFEYPAEFFEPTEAKLRLGAESMPIEDYPSREEVSARLEAVEARLDTKLVTIDSKLDRLSDRMEVAVNASNAAEIAAQDAKRASSTTKWHILFTALGVIAVLLAVWALVTQGMELIAGLLGARA